MHLFLISLPNSLPQKSKYVSVMCHSCDLSHDLSCDPLCDLQSEGTNPGSLHQVSGGVARNIAGTKEVNICANGVNYVC